MWVIYTSIQHSTCMSTDTENRTLYTFRKRVDQRIIEINDPPYFTTIEVLTELKTDYFSSLLTYNLFCRNMSEFV